MTTLKDLIDLWRTTPIEWTRSIDGVSYIGSVSDHQLLLTLNNFPDEPMFTIFGFDDAIDVEETSWRLTQKLGSGSLNRMNAIRESLSREEGKIVWIETGSPRVFKFLCGDDIVYWKFNIESSHEYTMITRHGGWNLSKVPDSWVIRKRQLTPL